MNCWKKASMIYFQGESYGESFLGDALLMFFIFGEWLMGNQAIQYPD